nr:MAG TPA: minor capsid protein [Caudoviricetes sp.]
MSLLSFRDIARIFEEIELRLIASLKRNLSRHKAEEEKEGFEWSAWQAEKLNNIDNFRKDNVQIADEYVDVIDDGTRQLMTDQFHEGEHTAEQSVIDVSESGVNVPDVPAQPQPPEAPTAIPDDHFFGVNKPKMDKLMEDVTTLEKTALTAAVRNMDDVYRTTLNKVQLMMGTGSITLNEAIDLATRDFLDKGINCIVYADGRRVNIADYVRMALRTTSTRATLQGAAKRFAELGYDTVLISQYGGCSETCEPYQGKVYIDDVFTIWNGERSGDFGKSNYCDKWFMLLSVAIRGGLFHPNCRHTMGQYIEGLTKIPQPIPAEKIREQRELEEKQRAMERKIRALKRKVEGTQDEKKVKEYKRKLRKEQGKLREFIKEHDDVLRRDYSREKIYSGKGEPKQTAPRTEEAPMSKLPENATPQLLEVTQDSPKAKKIMSEGDDKYPNSDIIKTERKSNIPKEVISDVNKAVEKVAEDFPVIKDQVEPIEYDDLYDALGVNGLRNNSAINVIKLSKQYCSDYSLLRQKLSDDYKNKVSYQTDNVGSLACHELGHAIHKILAFKRAGLEYGKPISAEQNILLNKKLNEICIEIYEAAFDDSFKTPEAIFDECANQLGSMAVMPNELIAQSFGNYYYGSDKMPIAKSIIEYFIKELS